MNPTRNLPALQVLVVGLTVVSFLLVVREHFSYSPDDTYIYLQFARNLLHGGGLAFNAGSPTYGFTSPLWLFLIASVGRTGADLLTAAKVADLILAASAIMVFFALARTVLLDVLSAVIATIAFSVNIWLVRWAATGMETSLSVVLLLTAFFFLLRRKYIPAGFAAGLLTLTRPETFWLAGLIAADGYLQGRKDGNRLSNPGSALGAWALPVVPWLVFAWREFGTIVSNTARAKSSSSADVMDMANEFAGAVKILLASDGTALAVIAVAVVLVPVFRRRRDRQPDSDGGDNHDSRTLILFTVWSAAVVVFYALEHVLVVSRYLLLVSPCLGLLAFLMLVRVLDTAGLKRFVRIGVVLAAAVMILQSQLVYRRVVAPGIEAFEGGMETCLIPIGRWLNERTTERDVILTWDIGAIGYYSGRTICDAAGLVTPGMISPAREEDPLNSIIRQKRYRGICPVTWIVHRAPAPEALRDDPDLEPVLVKPFYRMGLNRFETRYYTVYCVNGQPPGRSQ